MILESYPAIVMANDDKTDPNKEFGVSVRIDLLMPDDVWPEIAYPIFPPNFAKAPAVGQQVEVVVMADVPDPEYSTEVELGSVNYAHHIFYTGRHFDTDKGKIPAILQQDYPNRCGWWLEDGTMIWMNQAKNKKEINIRLTDGKTFIQLKEDEILLQQNTTTISLKNGVITMTDSQTKMGGSGANIPLVLGPMTTAMTTLFGAWLTAIQALDASGGTPAGVVAYAQAMDTAIAAIQGTLSNWNSGKHFADG